ncbi:hypothetical protein [Helicobacter saguini]|nr:hypothetical protein [Helicobacter saguini]MWV68748.1 hypothetical protein [Helicobacter saguini]
MYPTHINEIYTFNSPGLYPSKMLKGLFEAFENTAKISQIDSIIHGKENYLLWLNKIRTSNYAEYVYNIEHLRYETKENKEKYHKKMLKLIQDIKNGINKKYDYLPKGLIQEHIYHIQTDNDSNLQNNNYTNNAIQDLGVNIKDFYYFVNVGSFWDSHYLTTTIIELKTIILYMQSGNIDNLLEYNKIKDTNKQEMFIKHNTEREMMEIEFHNKTYWFAYWFDGISILAPPLPTPTNDLQQAIAYLDSNPIPQKPKEIYYADSNAWSNAMLQDLESYFRIYAKQSNLSYQYFDTQMHS